MTESGEYGLIGGVAVEPPIGIAGFVGEGGVVDIDGASLFVGVRVGGRAGQVIDELAAGLLCADGHALEGINIVIVGMLVGSVFPARREIAK